MKFLNLILGTFLGWFSSRKFSFAFALVLTIVAFFCADPNQGIPTANVAVFALAVGVLTALVLLFGNSIVTKSEVKWDCFGHAFVGSVLGVLLSLIVNTFV